MPTSYLDQDREHNQSPPLGSFKRQSRSHSDLGWSNNRYQVSDTRRAFVGLGLREHHLKIPTGLARVHYMLRKLYLKLRLLSLRATGRTKYERSITAVGKDSHELYCEATLDQASRYQTTRVEAKEKHLEKIVWLYNRVVLYFRYQGWNIGIASRFTGASDKINLLLIRGVRSRAIKTSPHDRGFSSSSVHSEQDPRIRCWRCQPLESLENKNYLEL